MCISITFVYVSQPHSNLDSTLSIFGNAPECSIYLRWDSECANHVVPPTIKIFCFDTFASLLPSSKSASRSEILTHNDRLRTFWIRILWAQRSSFSRYAAPIWWPRTHFINTFASLLHSYKSASRSVILTQHVHHYYPRLSQPAAQKSWLTMTN